MQADDTPEPPHRDGASSAPGRIAIVAGPDAGHAFPAFRLAELLAADGFSVTVFTGLNWLSVVEPRGIDIAELPGLDVGLGDSDSDAGQKLSTRAARMAILLAPKLAVRGYDLVVHDVITVAGAWAAELVGIPFIELSPHPLYRPSRGLPPVGAGLAPGKGLSGRLRDIAMRAASSRSVRAGERQRGTARSSIGLTPTPPAPSARFVATLPALEVPRPDWPVDTHIIGPLLWEPTTETFTRPTGSAPLIVIAPSTAVTGAEDMLAATLRGLGLISATIPVRVVISALKAPDSKLVEEAGLASVVVGLARQDEVLRDADLVICGAGHGMLAKSLLAGVPVVTVPGGGDQWELANRVQRQGAGTLIRPVHAEAVALAVEELLTTTSYRDAAALAAESAGQVVDPVGIVRHVLCARESGRGDERCD